MSIDLNLINNDNLRPRDEVRIERLEATPYSDGQRVKIEIDITPFRERPNLELTVATAQGQHAASTSIIAAMNFKMALNVHLRGVTEPGGDYHLQALLYYDDIQSPQDTRRISFQVPPQSTENGV